MVERCFNFDIGLPLVKKVLFQQFAKLSYVLVPKSG